MPILLHFAIHLLLCHICHRRPKTINSKFHSFCAALVLGVLHRFTELKWASKSHHQLFAFASTSQPTCNLNIKISS
ncbi:hypothetical protein C8J56DRAFT_916428 [Mycena floridula]|nr:hypothetical protein C8J56DRAFT_916428 [Mycena floridula]